MFTSRRGFGGGNEVDEFVIGCSGVIGWGVCEFLRASSGNCSARFLPRTSLSRPFQATSRMVFSRWNKRGCATGWPLRTTNAISVEQLPSKLSLTDPELSFVACRVGRRDQLHGQLALARVVRSGQPVARLSYFQARRSLPFAAVPLFSRCRRRE